VFDCSSQRNTSQLTSVVMELNLILMFHPWLGDVEGIATQSLGP
jgi:hypothetical protein